MDPFRRRVQSQYSALTRGQRQVARYVLDHPERLILGSAAQIGKEAGVSEATVIRFCCALGYTGFSEMQSEFREYFASEASSLESYVSTKRSIPQPEPFFKAMMEADARRILRVAETLAPEEMERAVQWIKDAPVVVVAGFYASHPASLWFGFLLNILRGGVRIFRPDTDQAALLAADLAPGATVVLFTFHRYAREAVYLAEAARARGARLIVMTDSTRAPVYELADIAILVDIGQTSTIDSAVPLFSVLNSILAGYSAADAEKVTRRIQTYGRGRPGDPGSAIRYFVNKEGD